jgi:iron complex outermembrane recepter protein
MQCLVILCLSGHKLKKKLLGGKTIMMKLRTKVCSLSLAISAVSSMAYAQEQEGAIEELLVTGIRASLQNAIEEKRAATNLIEVIQAEDIGKLPDQNLAEVMENITGVQITREGGVGVGVQIRGTDANRTEINGVSTVGAGSGRTGISFDDVSASMIAAVEVTKAPEAKTIEGSVGGTINLRTIRPLELKETLGSVRVQGEQSDLSADGGLTPRLSGTYGDNWSTGAGEFGVVVSASYAEMDVSDFRPRVDRDNLVAAGVNPSLPEAHLPIQFLQQDYDNYEYETKNISAAFEWAPSDNTKFYFDAIMNDQERRQESYRLQASGVSANAIKDSAMITDYEMIDFGTVDSALGKQDIGSIAAVTKGVLLPMQNGSLDPNLRNSTDTNARVTDSNIFRLGGEWTGDKLSTRVEVSTSTSETNTPNFSTTLNFINPNSFSTATSIDNGVPFEFDLTGGSLSFGIAQGLASTPTTAMLLDPANYRLASVNQSNNYVENKEDAFRVDFNYALDMGGITSIDVGYRFNESSSLKDVQTQNNTFSYVNKPNSDPAKDQRYFSPRGDAFASILSPGANNFNDADGRKLYIKDFLLVDPAISFSNPQHVRDVLNAAIVADNAANNRNTPTIDSPTSTAASYFDISEETNSLYAQANFELGIFRGNAGLRYLETTVDSLGNSVVNGVATPSVKTGSYNFLLPRINLVADLRDDLVLRAGWGKDIRRPDFDDLSTSYAFQTTENAAVAIGNPNLEPEEVTSFDLSAEWYFAPSSVFSAGIFHKVRTGLHVNQTYSAAIDASGYREIDPACKGGGLWNPIAVRNRLRPDAEQNIQGLCVDTTAKVNGAGETKQEGIELAFQYDLSEFEDTLGWASGFGFVTNYTYQQFSGGDTFKEPVSRADQVFTLLGHPDVSIRAALLNLSENAYNITAYYEKYDVSARVRYTWRDEFTTNNYGSGGDPWGFYAIQEARGQLNASINYDVTEQLNIGVEAINLLREDTRQYCVNSGALLCYQGLTDRRITLGASYKF